MEKKKLLWMYLVMQKARKFEEMVSTLFEQNRLRGSVHIGIGQEAILAGAIGVGPGRLADLSPDAGGLDPCTLDQGHDAGP